MKEFKLNIVGHSADLKTMPTESKDTGIFFPQELIDFIGSDVNLSFTIYKEDCAKALASIISSLPLYSNKGGKIITHSDVFDECSRLYSMIANYFGGSETATYGGFSLTETTGGRRYLYGLEQRGFSIRKLLLANYSSLVFQKRDNGDLILRFYTYIPDGNKNALENPLVVNYKQPQDIQNEPIQQIFYGAPGTGKSKTIKDKTEEAENVDRVFRTTFHPDSDYSTFVGCYKPTTQVASQQAILDYDSLVDRFKKYISDFGNITHASAAIGYDYHDSIVRMQESGIHTIADLLADAHKSGTTYDTTIRSGMLLYEEQVQKGKTSNKISYAFVPQVFTNAYVKAWNTEENVYLIIEEINRGNCAQIFGDLFQLLDRDSDGISEYPIMADKDLAKYLKGKDEDGQDVLTNKDGIKDGKLRLPKNLYIWATMNTSDQSLFPIDSAFKRRWDWKYIPIKEHPDKNYKIEIGEKTYDWWGFLERINKVIGDTTSSEDKKLGYFFVKTETSKVGDEQFVGKVLFYLWNDVFKNYGFDHTIFSKGDKDKFVFSDFFNADGTPSKDNVQLFLKRVEDAIKIDRPLDITPKEETTTVSEEATVAEA